MDKSSSQTGHSFYLSGNPWDCTCQNIEPVMQFLMKYSTIIKDVEHIRCDKWDTPILQADYKEKCSESQNPMIWVVMVELILLLLLIGNFVRDVVRYRRTGHLPWVARHLCYTTHGRAGNGGWGRLWTRYQQTMCGKTNQNERVEKENNSFTEERENVCVKFTL